ncbi:MAG: hypothetical protein AAB336_03055, partial [Acidobacteriota bacterium]
KVIGLLNFQLFTLIEFYSPLGSEFQATPNHNPPYKNYILEKILRQIPNPEKTRSGLFGIQVGSLTRPYIFTGIGFVFNFENQITLFGVHYIGGPKFTEPAITFVSKNYETILNSPIQSDYVIEIIELLKKNVSDAIYQLTESL